MTEPDVFDQLDVFSVRCLLSLEDTLLSFQLPSCKLQLDIRLLKIGLHQTLRQRQIAALIPELKLAGLIF